MNAIKPTIGIGDILSKYGKVIDITYSGVVVEKAGSQFTISFKEAEQDRVILKKTD